MNKLARPWPLVAVVLLIAVATLVPVGVGPPRFFWGFDWSDLVVNLGLYLPLGLLLARAELPTLRISAIAILLSVSIELLQATVIPGRRGSPVDGAVNLLGALAGMGCYRAAFRLRAARTRRAMTLAAVGLGVPIALWTASGPPLAPHSPNTPVWWGQWAHLFGGTVPFRGSILSVELFDHAVPDGPNDSTAVLEAAARRGPLRLEVTLRSGGPSEGLTHLASVADGVGRFVIGLEQTGRDLLLSWRSRGGALGLRDPWLVFPGALAAAEGERVTVLAGVSATRASIAVIDGSGRHEATRLLSPVTGWRNLIPTRGVSATTQRWFDLVWAAGLAGYVALAVSVLRWLRLSY